jgi:hypothetical protein
MPSWKKVITSGSNATLNEITSSGGIQSTDVTIDEWGSISASLASIDSGASSLTLQDTTDNGSRTTNSITASAYSGSYIDFDPADVSYSHKEGRVSWNHDEGTLNVDSRYSDVSLQVGQEFHIISRNASGATIQNGCAVYLSGVTGGSARPEITKFVADASVREHKFLGLATHDISNGVNGIVTTQGYVRGLDTTGDSPTAIAVGDETWEEGDTLYVHPTVPGKLTNVEPFHSIQVGFITQKHGSVGEIYVQKYTAGHLDYLHDVTLDTNSLAIGDLLVYDIDNQGQWRNGRVLSGSYQIDNGNFTVDGTVDSDDITIDDWGSVSASLASIDSAASNLTLQDITDNGSTTTNSITATGLTINGNATITGTASIGFLQSVTGSAKIIGDAYIILNADSPTERYSGLKVYDSGSGDTGSLEYDSVNNHWFYESTNEGYASGFIAGPRDSRGNITFPPNNRIPKGIGGNHISASSISDDGSTITLGNDTNVDGVLNISSVSNAGNDTDKFLVLDSNGNVDYRTGNEVRSDIGAAGAANLSGAPSELAFFGSSTEVTSSRRISLLNTASTDAQSLVVQGQIQVINDPTRNVGGSSPMQIVVGSGSTGDINNPQYDSFISMEQESANQVALRANGSAPTAAQFKMRTDVNDAYSIGRLTNPYGANTFRIKPTIIAEGGLSITGSLTVSGSNTLINQGPAHFSGSVSITTADQVQASTDTDKFLVLDGDQIKYRSGAQVRSDIGATAAQNLQSVTDTGNSTTNVIQMPNFTLSTPTNNNAGSDKILVLDGSNRSKIRTRDQLRDDIGALQASKTPQMIVTAAEVLDEAVTQVYIPFSGINIFPETNTTAYSRFYAPYDGYIKEIIVHPHEAGTSGTCTITPNIDGVATTGVQETISATAGVSTTFSFGVSGYSFSDGDHVYLEFDRELNTRSKGFSFTIVFIMDTTS